jgi:hypothetical protein
LGEVEVFLPFGAVSVAESDFPLFPETADIIENMKGVA